MPDLLAKNLKRLANTGRAPGNPGNSGGKKGRSGRKPHKFKVLCTEILEDARTQAELRRAARDCKSPGYSGVMKLLAAYSEGLPAQEVKHGLTDSLAELLEKSYAE